MALTGSSFFDDHPIFVLDHSSLDILDVNEIALQTYGYSREEFLEMNISQLGEKKRRQALITSLREDATSDKVWLHTTKEGDEFYVQFTFHIFNYRGNPAKLVVAHDVSELIERDEENRALFPKAQTGMSESPLAIIEWNRDMTVKEWSEKATDLFGWSEDEVVGDKDFFSKFVHEDELDNARKRFRELCESGEANYTIEGRNYTRDGKVLNCEWYNSVLYNKDGELVSIYALVHDISERKQSENLFRALSEESLVGVYLIQDGIFKYINPRFAKIFHYKKEEIEGKLGPLDLAHPDDRHIVDKNIKDRIDGRIKAIEYDFRCMTKDSQIIHVNVYGTGIEYQGEPAIVGTIVDITDSKLAFERYKASIESFEDLFDSISDAIYIQKKDGKFLQVNKGAVEMYGYDREYFIGKTPEFLAAPGKVDMEKTLGYLEKAIAGEPQQFEWWGKRKNGEVFPKEIVLNPGTYFGERVVIAIARDISERFESQEQIRKNEELFRQLFQNAHIGIAMMDEHQEIRLVNDAFEDIFGYSSEDIRGLDIDKLIVPEEEMTEARELSAKTFKGISKEMTSVRKRKDGSLVDVLIYGVPVKVDGRTIAIFGIYVDITERKRAEEQIRQSLKEKEVLLAEIHHRVKNNLAVITGLLELQSYNTQSDEAIEIIKESQFRINSIALIHEKLYQSKDLSQISFDVYIRELSDIIWDSISDASRDISLDIEADPVQLTVNQAIPCGLILNELITNAFKHAFNGRKDGEINITLCEESGNIAMQVRDNGRGLPDDFDQENPSSLGMKLIHTLTQQLNGQCNFANHEEGAGFKLEFEVE